ncbi:MFS transporter [Nocardia mexicana]|uniref:Putative MFS family arabinose efflux permease n=1 Tax=Nocardia mexicana TaxID=279262 RepID=A0A370GL64_9NOCA|nr:MFS transporter [Nocardia mexicana]RDI44411.1 putative MFS family arabinose efflux permease [Nocardia mexicana]
MDHSEKVLTTPASTTPARGRREAATLVLLGTLTTMAGATVAPAIPGIRTAFAGVPNADLLVRMIITTHAIAIVAFAPLAGLIADRLGRRSALLAGLVAFGVGGSSGAYLPNLAAILAGRIILGVGVSLIMTSSVAMIADKYEGDARRRLLGQQVAATAFGGVAFLLGGGALADLDWRMVFLVYLLGSLLIVPTLAYLQNAVPAKHPVGQGGTTTPSVRARVAAPLVAMLLGQIAFYAVPVQVPFLVEDEFGAGALASGTVIAAMVFTMGMVALQFARLRPLADEHTLMALSYLAIALGLLVMSVAGTLYVLTLGLFVMAAGVGLIMPNAGNWVVTVAPEHLRGRYSGRLTTAMFLGQFVSPIVTQPVADALGIQPTFAVLAAAALPVAAVYFVLGRRR